MDQAEVKDRHQMIKEKSSIMFSEICAKREKPLGKVRAGGTGLDRHNTDGSNVIRYDFCVITTIFIRDVLFLQLYNSW